ncbi:MAG TPA: DUF4412 domain-containing protein, partial [Chitinispirillaceae bacterium]|nr:DUF4412 domain-containing protein [Chitinispirillaceae bacterium]
TAAITVSADNYLVQKKHTDAFKMMGQTVPAKDEQSVMWSSSDKMCLNPDKDTVSVIRLDKKVLWVIYKKNKKYSELDLDALAAMADVPGMGNMMNVSATVTPTTETKQIGKWNCTKYQISSTMPMTTIETVSWNSTDIKVDYDAYAKMKNFASAVMPGFGEMIKEFQKIKGFPVFTESVSKIMGNEVKSSEELIEISEKAAPAGIYDIPSGFKKTKN